MSGHDETPSLVAPILLLIAAVSGFAFANSPLSETYNQFLQTKLMFAVGGYELINKSVLLLINDGLMAVFFLFVGLELKREIVAGELSQVKQALMPIAGAIGGMMIPALIYASINFSDPEGARGWGIPMATDIAFALGVLAVLGKRVPASLKVLLVAIAIVDDLGAILVIALFYTAKLNMVALGAAGAFLAVCVVMNRFNVRRVSAYMLVGIPLWYFMLKSGVHATIAGVALAFTIPLVKRGENASGFVKDVMHDKISQLQSPAIFLEHSLLKWVGLVIVPIFAFANSGVDLGSFQFGAVALGVSLGLFLGKPIGIVGAAFLMNKFGLASLPKGVSWRHMTGVGLIAGIGFTMSLFISSLAFTNPNYDNEAKAAILIGSMLAGTVGSILLSMPSRGGQSAAGKKPEGERSEAA